MSLIFCIRIFQWWWNCLFKKMFFQFLSKKWSRLSSVILKCPARLLLFKRIYSMLSWCQNNKVNTTLCIQGQRLFPQQTYRSRRGLGHSQGPGHLQLRNEPKNAFWEPHNSPQILHLNFFLFWKMYSWQLFFIFHVKTWRWLRTPMTFWNWGHFSYCSLKFHPITIFWNLYSSDMFMWMVKGEAN